MENRCYSTLMSELKDNRTISDTFRDRVIVLVNKALEDCFAAGAASRDGEISRLKEQHRRQMASVTDQNQSYIAEIAELKAKINLSPWDREQTVFGDGKQEGIQIGRREVVDWGKVHAIFTEHGAEFTESGIKGTTKPVFITEEIDAQLKLWKVEVK